MLFGFSRLVALHEVKRNYFQATIAQELMLHTIPLTMLMMYNNKMLDKEETLDLAGIYLGYCNLLFNYCEISFYRYWANRGVNLEQRVKMSTNRRVCDLMRITFLSVLFGGAFILAGNYAFE